MNNISYNSSSSEDLVANYKWIVNIDKLELTAKFNYSYFKTSRLSDNIKITDVTKVEAIGLSQKNGRMFKDCFKLYFKDLHSATVFYRGNLDTETNCLIVFKNHTFYTYFNEFFNELVYNEVMCFENVSIHKLDIALDINTNFMNTMHLNYIKFLEDKLYLKNKSLFDIGRKRLSYYVGAGKYFNIYDKLEKLQKESKHYITEYYTANSFNLSEGVNRIELRLTRGQGGFIARLIDSINHDKLCDKNYLKNIIIKIITEKLWVIYTDNKNASRRRREPLTGINFESLISNETIYLNEYKKQGASIGTIKSYIKKLDFDWIRLNKSTHSDLYKLKCYLIEHHNLEEWYKNFRQNEKNHYNEYWEYKQKFW